MRQATVWAAIGPDKPVGNVNLGIPVFVGDFALDEVGDLDSQVGTLFKVLGPVVVAIGIRQRHHIESPQDVEFVTELGLAAGGYPRVLREVSGSNDGGFLGLNQAY